MLHKIMAILCAVTLLNTTIISYAAPNAEQDIPQNAENTPQPFDYTKAEYGNIGDGIAKCPTCGLDLVRTLEPRYHRVWRVYGDKSKVSHPDWFLSGYNMYEFNNGDISDYTILDYDGNPINLPWRPDGGSYEADGTVDSVLFIIKMNGQKLRSNCDFEKGLYERYDGQVFQFDKDLLFGAKKLTAITPDIKSLIYNDLRFVDWLCINNSPFPDDVTWYLQNALLLNNINKGLESDDPRRSENANQIAYWKEVALERLYGLR